MIGKRSAAAAHTMGPADRTTVAGSSNVTSIVTTAFFAAVIFLGIQSFRIPLRYQIEVHGLKSASANIGAMEVSALARAQENAAVQGDLEFIRSQFPILMAEYETLLANIGQFLEWRGREKGRKEKLPCLTLQEFMEETGAALEELKHFRSQKCAERVEAMLAHELPECGAKRLLEIQEQLRLYEDDKAEELLGQLLDILEKRRKANA